MNWRDTFNVGSDAESRSKWGWPSWLRDEDADAEPSGRIEWPDASGNTPGIFSETRLSRDDGGVARARLELDLSGRNVEDELEGSYGIGALADETGLRSFVGLELSTDEDAAPEIGLRTSSSVTSDGIVEGSLRLSIRGNQGDGSLGVTVSTELGVTPAEATSDLFG